MNLKQNITSYGRFKDLPWFNPISTSRIAVFGQGGIGSHLTFFLARTGANLTTVDCDTVDDTNLAGQLYGKKQIGLPKVRAMYDVISMLCGENNIKMVNQKVEALDDPNKTMWGMALTDSDVVCVSFDSIAVRKIVYEAWQKIGKKGSLFVDGRMSAENGQVFTVGKEDDPKFYESSFFDDSELPEAPCTAKATSHCGSMIASLMVSQITNWFNNQLENAFPRTVVKQLDFHLPVMLFEELEEPKKQEDAPVPQ